MERLHNNYIKIKPLEHESFIPTDHPTYQELGMVLAKDDSMRGWGFWKKPVINLEIGDKVKFDRFLAFKIPVEGKDDEFDWYVKFSEVISSENAR